MCGHRRHAVLPPAILALAALVSCLSYMRPGQLFSLNASQLVPPAQIAGGSHDSIAFHPSDHMPSDPSKTGEMDKNVIRGSLGWEWIDDSLRVLLASQPLPPGVWALGWLPVRCLSSTFLFALCHNGRPRVGGPRVGDAPRPGPE